MNTSMITDELPVVFLMGPTASGKTDLAVQLCQKLPFEIISVDSAMVYRGMDIGTAKPGPEILRIAPHRLIDVCEVTEIYSAGRFRREAQKAIKDIHNLEKIPLLVGGTGLYFRALELGIADLPPADPAIRQRLEREAGEIGWQALHQRLAGIDADSANRIHPNDPQRIQRALEVFEIKGKSLSDLFIEGRQSPLPYRIWKIIIAPAERSIIHDRARHRFMQMIELGFVDEVREFYERGDIKASQPCMRMVGYRQIWRFLDGFIGYQEMLEHVVVATRQMAKRQLTWLRSERDGVWLDSSKQNILDKTLKFIQEDSNIATIV